MGTKNREVMFGVVENYHHQSAKNAFLPMIMVNNKDDILFYTVSVNSNLKSLKTITQDLQTIWTQVYPENPFTYFFLDERYNHQYQADLAMGKVFSAFSIFAILITCLGLFGRQWTFVLSRAASGRPSSVFRSRTG